MCKTFPFVLFLFENLPAFAVDEYIARFHVAVNNVSRMNKIRCVEQLIHDVAFVYVF